MLNKAKRAKVAPRLEPLESRTLLSISDVYRPVPGTIPRADAADSILVRFASDALSATVAADLNAVGGHVVETFPNGPTWIAIGPGVSRDAALRQLQADPGVVYAEADATFHVSSVSPNDPLFNQQWGLNNPNDVDIDAPAAWGITIGSPSTIVAVLDTGIDVSNPDLAGRLWTNPNPYGDPGYYDDVHGWNFVTNTNNVQDNNGHGTHVSGVIAAWSNNGVGVTGINWNAQIMPVKVLDANGNGTTDAAVSGIYFAVNHGARVINASWGGGDYSQAMIDALNYANSRGVVFVTAAGNGDPGTNIGTNNDSIPTYPASYRLPNEIAVAAVDQWGNLASFSNYGPNTVDLAAPGVNILSTVPGGYASFSGSSMATSYVTGVVSLLVGLHPDWSAPQLVHQIRATVKPLPGLAGRVITGGMVDVYNAVANAVTTIPYVNGTLTVTPAPVTVLRVSLQKIRVSRLKTKTVIVLQLSGAVNQGAAQNPQIYNLATVPQGRRHRVVPVPVSQAVYNGGQNTITLFTTRPLSLNPPLQLRIVAAGVPDALGRPLDGNYDGQPGGDFLATLTNRGVSIARFQGSAGSGPLSAHALDHLRERGLIPSLSRPSRHLIK